MLRVVLVLVLLLNGGWAPAAAQAPEGRPVVGLALSGGAARGLAHIGVIQVLEAEGIPVDVVSGTSMGALIGGLYAVGHDGAALEATARGFVEADVFTDAVPRRFLSPDQRALDRRVIFTLPIRDGGLDLPSGAVEGVGVIRALERETWPAQAVEDFDGLPRPFTAVAADLRTGNAVVLRDGGVAEAIRASIAIPGALDPAVRGDSVLVDGMLVRNLPAEDARTLGAELLICSDVSRGLDDQDFETAVDVLARAISPTTEADIAAQRAPCDVVLRPVRTDAGAGDFDQVDRWIEVGRAAATEAMPEIRAALEARRGRGAHPAFEARHRARRAALLPDSVRVREIRVEGLSAPERADPARRALGSVGVAPGRWVHARRMDEGLAGIQATELFRAVTYRISDVEGLDATLVVSLAPARRDRVGVGLRYDSEYQASLLFTASFPNRLGYGSSTRLEVRLGEEKRVMATHFRGRGVTSPLGLGAAAGYVQVRLPERGVELMHLSGRAELIRSRIGIVGVEIAAEGIRRRVEDENGEARRRLDPLVTVGVVGRGDTFDRESFPHQGTSLALRADLSLPELGSDFDFSQVVADVQAALPLARRWTARARLYVGHISGTSVPSHRLLRLGGALSSAVLPLWSVPLVGVPRQSVSGTSAQLVSLGLQWEFRREWFATLTGNAGDARDEWAVEPSGWTGGWGLGLGTRTPIGPVEALLSGQDRLEGVRLTVSIGYGF
ncbi:MAG TPA: patatin-like phospholipase family protein [Longimicrobiales bacterium]|nr:patatin-like phospholipase family protein [Longimicrobiales bacterium]